VEVSLPPPWLLTDCPAVGGGGGGGSWLRWPTGGSVGAATGEGGEWLVRRAPGGQAPPLAWHVPAGNLDHAPLVALATTAATAACSGAIVWAALRAAAQQRRRPGPRRRAL
jgi:hypothetical protein